MKKIIYIIIFILIIGISYSAEYNKGYLDSLTRSIADELYCKINGDCTLSTLTVTENIILEENLTKDDGTNSKMYFENGSVVTEI